MNVARKLWSRLWTVVSSPLGRYSLLMFAVLRIGDVSMLACKFFLGRHLPAGIFGALDPFLSVLVILGMPVAILCQTAVKTISRLEAMGQHARRTAFLQDLMLIGLAGSLLSCFAVLLLNRFILSRLHLEGTNVIPLMIGLTFLTWWPPLTIAALQGVQKYAGLAEMSALNPVLVLVLTFVFVGPLGLNLQGAVAARLAAGFVAALFAFTRVMPMLKGPREPYSEELRGLASTLLPMSVFMASQIFLFHFDRLFVRNFLVGDSDGYSAVLTLGQIPLWLAGPVTLILLPMASAEHARGKDLRKLTWEALLIGGVPAVLSALLLWPAAEPILRFWKPAFAPYAPLVWKYALAMGIECAIQFWGNIDIARHRYGGFWWMLGCTLAYCAFLYSSTSWMTLDCLILAFIGVRVLILTGMVTIHYETTRRQVSLSGRS